MAGNNTTIGVLGLQGAVEEHIRQIEFLGLQGIIVKKPEQLDDIDGLILPGGESTAMRRLIDQYSFLEPLKQFASNKKPIFGTCAGMVLAANHLSGTEESHLNLIDISVKRNAFGRQRESFEAELDIYGIDSPITAVFIRAPLIEKAGENVEILAKFEEKIVAARQDHVLVCSFHPELTADTRFLQVFVQMVKESKQLAV